MEMRQRSSITRVIIYAFAALFLLYVVHTLLFTQGRKNLTRLTKTIYDHPLVVSNASLKASNNILKMHRNMKDVVLFSDPVIVIAAIKEVEDLEEETYAQLRLVEENILGEQGEKLAAEALLLFRQWSPIRSTVIANIRKGERLKAAHTTRAEGADHVARLENKMAELTNYARNKAQGFWQNTLEVDRQMTVWTRFIFGSWIILSFLIAYFTVKRTSTLEKSVIEEREKLRVTIRSIGDGVIVTDTAGKITIINQVAEELTGWPESEALGRDISSVFHIINETSRIPCENMIEKVLEADGIVGLANHTLLVAKDGTEKAIADSGAPVRDVTGNITGVVLVFRDQTKERRYQNRLRESERRYRLFSDNALDLIWTMNLNLEFTFVNQAITALTGFSEKEWVGSHLSRHCSKQEFLTLEKIVTSELAHGLQTDGFLLESAWLAKDGESVPVEIQGNIVYDDAGTPLWLQGVARDITERKKAEEHRRYQANLLQQMGKVAKIGGWEFDPRTGEGSWTDEVARIHDLDPSVKTSMNLGLSFYQSKDRQKIEAAIQRAVKEKKPYDLELQLTTAKAARKWVRTIGIPKVEDGEVVQIHGSFQDITDSKHSEQRIAHLNKVLRTIRDINQVIIRENDATDLIRACSRILVENRGYDCAILILTDKEGKPFSWGTAGLAEESESLRDCIKKGRLPHCCKACEESNTLVSIERRNACSVCTSIAADSARPILCSRLISEQTCYGYLVVAISEELQIDEEEKLLFEELVGDLAYALSVIDLQQAGVEAKREREELENQLIQAQKLESVGRLAGGVAHDFNNMLNVIMGFTEIALDQTKENGPLAEELNEIMNAAKRAAEITKQLLAFARRQTISPSLLDLNETVGGLLKMLQRLIGEDIDLAWLPAPGLWIVKMDPSQVDQILANLCVNARDAIEGVGKITIETANAVFDEKYCRDHIGFLPGEYIMLGVSDDGIGMNRETLKNIFEPFYTTKNVGEGTGLGLSMVYGIVKQNDGFVNVYSEPEKGTTIKIYLPRHAGTSKLVDVPAIEEIPTGSGETILLVEDETAILRMGEKMLASLGYKVLASETPEKALELADKHQGDINLLVTDVVMPGMNGRDLAAKLLAVHKNMKVLFMSGYTANVIAHRGVLDKGVHFMPKPFSKGTLAQKVRDTLEN